MLAKQSNERVAESTLESTLSKQLIPPSLLALLSARSSSPTESPSMPIPQTASPLRQRKHGSRLQAAAKQQLSARLPIKRKLEEQLGSSTQASPVRTTTGPNAAATSVPAASPVRRSATTVGSSPAPFGLTMLRQPTAASSAAANVTTPGGTGLTPNKRHRLDTDGLLPRLHSLQPPPSTATPTRSATFASSSSTSSSPAASPPRPFYSMPAHPLTPADLFPRRRSPSPSPPTSRSASRSGSNSSRPSPSKKNLFGSMLMAGNGGGGGSGGSRKRLRDAAALTPGLHNSKGIHCFTLGEDTADDRAKKVSAHRAYEEWMDGRRKAEANKKREEAKIAREKQPHRSLQHRLEEEAEEMESDEEIELMLTGKLTRTTPATSVAAASMIVTSAAAASSSVTAVSSTAVSASAVDATPSALASPSLVISSPPIIASLATTSHPSSPTILASSLIPLVPFTHFPDRMLSSTAVPMNAITLTTFPSVAMSDFSATVSQASVVYSLAPYQPTA